MNYEIPSQRKILVLKRDEVKILRHTDEVMYTEKFLQCRSQNQNLAVEVNFVIQGIRTTAN